MNAESISAWMRDQFEVSRDSRSNIASMEGLRGVAVLLVFFAHYVTQVEPWITPGSLTWIVGDHLRSLGHMGVDLFFVLSGYLIYGTLIRRQRPIVDFLAKRAARIYPTFLFAFGLYLALSYVFPAQSKLPADPGNTLIYLAQNLLFLPGMVSIEPLIVVSWSLSYEFFYYLAMPLVISALALRKWAPAKRLMLFAAVAVIGFGCFCFNPGGHIRLMLFVGGILLFEIQTLKRVQATRWSGITAFTVAIVALTFIKHAELPGWTRYVTLFLCLSWLCFECFTVEGGTARLFSLTPLRWLGNISYSYYLIHGLALKAFVMVFAKFHAPQANEDYLFWALLPLVFTSTVIVSVALFIGIEKPMSLVAATPAVTDESVPAPIPVFARLARALSSQASRISIVDPTRIWPGIQSSAALKLLRQIAALLIPLGMGFSVYALVIV